MLTGAGVLSAFVPNQLSLLALRVVQGAGSSAALVIGRAVARDLCGRRPLIRVMAPETNRTLRPARLWPPAAAINAWRGRRPSLPMCK